MFINSYLPFYNCKCPPSLESMGYALKQVANKVFLLAYLVFQNVICLIHLQFRAIYWNCKNFKNLETPVSSLLFSSLAFSSHAIWPEAFQELIEAFQEIEQINDEQLGSFLNQRLSLGTCHAQCMELINLIRETSSFCQSISMLEKSKSNVILFQILEIMRPSFEQAERDDLLEKLNALLPSEQVSESQFSVEDNIKEALQNEVLNSHQNLIVTRLFNRSVCHSVILYVNHEEKKYGFYNSDFAGYYQYEDLQDFEESFYQHVKAYTIYLKPNSENFWNFASYSL